MKNLNTTMIVITTLLLGACSLGGTGIGSLGDCCDIDTPLPDQAMGGVWKGTDDNGVEILALSTDSGRLHWIAPSTGEQGFGTGSSSFINLTINYTYVAPFGFKLADGSASAACTGGGVIDQRVSFSPIVTCTTTLGSSFRNSGLLTYDALYDRDSSLALVAGNYDNSGRVMNVTATGEMFEQDPASGCVINGQISLVNSRYNVYGVSVTYSNCVGDSAVWNGATFTGLGILDNTVAPETAVIGLTGTVGGETYSIVYSLPRL